MNCEKYDYYAPEWCPGCGNFDTLQCVKQALCDLNIEPNEIIFVMGIGQASKLGFSVRANAFDGLHGRSLPLAVGIKLANKDARVIAVAGDADFYAEGGNHFLHACRRNLDVTILAGNNRVFGLTKGQAAPTASYDYSVNITGKGVGGEPVRPALLGLAAGATFVAKGFSGNKEELTGLIKQALQHRGVSLVDIMFPCVTFNRVNTFQWFKQHASPIAAGHDPADFEAAVRLANQDEDRGIPTGVYYQVQRPVYGDNLTAMQGDPIVKRTLAFTPDRVKPIFDVYK